MLAYLDALLGALAVRDTAEVERLLAHPLARILPDDARAEARAIGLGDGDALAAPLRVMHLRHMTAELLREAPDAPLVADRSPSSEPGAAGAAGAAADVARDARRPAAPATRRAARLVQMELPLSA